MWVHVPLLFNVRVLSCVSVCGQAVDLGERLLALMETPSGIATFTGTLKRPSKAADDGAVFATAGTFSLEMTTLSRITGGCL